MDRLLRLGGAGMGGGAAPSDAPVVDTAEQVYISSLALLKMLKHGRAGHYLISTYILLFC
jgi:26S proteasome regulatory subunit N11